MSGMNELEGEEEKGNKENERLHGIVEVGKNEGGGGEEEEEGIEVNNVQPLWRVLFAGNVLAGTCRGILIM